MNLLFAVVIQCKYVVHVCNSDRATIRLRICIFLLRQQTSVNLVCPVLTTESFSNELFLFSEVFGFYRVKTIPLIAEFGIIMLTC